jgi:hypothetical protein
LLKYKPEQRDYYFIILSFPVVVNGYGFSQSLPEPLPLLRHNRIGQAGFILGRGGIMADDKKLTVLNEVTSISGSNTLLYVVDTSGSSPIQKKIKGDNFFNSAKFGDTSNYTSFEADGTMVMTGSARVWDDIFAPLTTAKQGQTDKPPFTSTEIAYLFPQADTSAIMYIIIQFPHGYALGTDVEPHVHWKQTQSGSVVFKMNYKWFDIGGEIPAAFSNYVMAVPSIQYTSGNVHQLTSGSAHISGSSITSISSIMLVALYRDDNTYTGTAITYQFDIHYQKDTVGSRTDNSK